VLAAAEEDELVEEGRYVSPYMGISFILNGPTKYFFRLLNITTSLLEDYSITIKYMISIYWFNVFLFPY